MASPQEVSLAARYAPVIKLVGSPEECGAGEPYVPIDVDALFDQPTVALRGPWSGANLVKVGPSAADLARGLYGYHLDFPGDALDPGCTYLDWSRRLMVGRVPTVYAHVVGDPDHPGQIALQYWMFYVFNDWNNLHEGDWEMIQLDFHAGSASQALTTRPYEVGYSQHEGAERAAWDDPEVELIGTHPVVYPAAGSHANFFSSALWLGASGSQGVGCDDTRGADLVVHPAVDTIPGAPGAALAAYPWLGFQGRWGEQQPAFFNGPTGPNLKPQWTHPIGWSEGWRDRAYAVPTGGALGTSTTDFFCAAMTHGSRLLWQAVRNPLPTVAAVAVALVLLVYGLRRSTWRPTAPLRLARRRTWGQVLSASARIYTARLRLFVGLGLVALPVSVVITLLQAGLVGVSSVLGVENQGAAASLFVLIALAIGIMLTLLSFGLVQAAAADALVALDEQREIGPVQAYRIVLRTAWPLVGALLIGAVVVSVLATSLLLIPIAIWFAISWSLIAPAIALEGVDARTALRRSRNLVRGGWLKVGSLTIVAAAIALVAGPALGTVLIVVTDLPLPLLNLIAGIVYTIVMPFVGLTTAYVYFDARVREQLRPPQDPRPLPAEIDL